LRLPECGAHDDRQRCPRTILTGTEGPSEQRPRPKHIEEGVRHGALSSPRAATVGKQNVDGNRPVRRAAERDALESPGLPTEFQILVVGELAGRIPELRPHHDQPLGLRHVHRLEQHRFDDAEHRGAGADSQREGEDGSERQRWLFRQTSDG
jgi:hypothetical protein